MRKEKEKNVEIERERKLAETKETSSILSIASKCIVEYRWK